MMIIHIIIVINIDIIITISSSIIIIIMGCRTGGAAPGSVRGHGGVPRGYM